MTEAAHWGRPEDAAEAETRSERIGAARRAAGAPAGWRRGPAHFLVTAPDPR